MIKNNIIIFVLIFLFLVSCDKGLEPLDVAKTANLNVNISFVNDWPKKDSVFGFRVAAFKLPPSESLLGEISNGNATISDLLLDYDIKTTNVQFIYKDLPIDLQYIVVAWQYESSLTSQRIVGVYNKSNKSEPGTVKLNYGDAVNIDIEVDWNDFPPQPF
jgi:hypothetical protein